MTDNHTCNKTGVNCVVYWHCIQSPELTRVSICVAGESGRRNL